MKILKFVSSGSRVLLSCCVVVLCSIVLESYFCNDLFSSSGALLIVIGLYVAWHREYSLGAKSEELINAYTDIENSKFSNEILKTRQAEHQYRYNKSLREKKLLETQYRGLKEISPESPAVIKLGEALSKVEKTSQERKEKNEQFGEKIDLSVKVTERARELVAESIDVQRNTKKKAHALEFCIISIGTIIWAYGSLLSNFAVCYK